MTELLSNFIGGQWRAGKGAGTALHDPVLGTELVRVDATGLDLPAAFAFARQQGGSALRALTYRQRAALLSAAAKVLQANRDAYCDISTANSGTVKNDTAVDVDGGIYTLGTYAKMGEGLGDVLDEFAALGIVAIEGERRHGDEQGAVAADQVGTPTLLLRGLVPALHGARIGGDALEVVGRPLDDELGLRREVA